MNKGSDLRLQFSTVSFPHHDDDDDADAAVSTPTTTNTTAGAGDRVGDFFLASSSTPAKGHENPRRKRSKLVRIDSPAGASSKPKHGRKPDPTAPKITRPCSECGKKFWSWKALFGHMRCHPERQWRGINPPPNFRRPISPMSLHSSISDPPPSELTEDDQEVAACLLMLANGQPPALPMGAVHGGGDCRFECSSCKKVFGSHQALGGHRASHKNVKGCFAMTKSGDQTAEDEFCYEDQADVMMMMGAHRCSICLKVFPSGQALGGHKRCHWDRAGGEDQINYGGIPKTVLLDLNLPPSPSPHPNSNITDDFSSSSSPPPASALIALDLRLTL